MIRTFGVAAVVALLGVGALRAEIQKLTDVEGIGAANAAKLEKAGVKTGADLLARAGTRADREKLASETGLSTETLLKWANRVDLSRIKGVSTQYSDLLESAGVDTPKELARRNPENLRAELEKVNASKKLVHQLPSVTQIDGWIKEAKGMKPAVEY
jgi:predicted flap endonuclease-1-like 5' DNA nuclease